MFNTNTKEISARSLLAPRMPNKHAPVMTLATDPPPPSP